MINKNIKKIAFIIILAISILPSFTFAQEKLDYSGLVQCDGVITPGETERQRVCDFNALMATIKYAINWLFYITIPIATVAFAYAGILYMTGNPSKIGTAKSIFQSVASGFIIMLVAWISVVTVVDWFVEKNSGFDAFIGK
jgi:hypothetical protein